MLSWCKSFKIFLSQSLGQPQSRKTIHTYTSATICFLSRSVIRSKLSSLRANIWGECKDTRQWCGINQTHQAIGFPSHFTDNTKRTVAYNVQRLVRVKKRGCHRESRRTGGRIGWLCVLNLQKYLASKSNWINTWSRTWRHDQLWLGPTAGFLRLSQL